MRRLLETSVAVIFLCCSCSDVPSGIIGHEEMAQLMADIHTGESVVEMNRRQYPTDSTKKAFRDAVYARHGVDEATVDSSIAWYGRNISHYMEVYDRTIEILEHRLIETGNRIAAEAAMSMSGDSVDVWSAPRYFSVTDRTPSQTLTFNFGRDPNWERGDTYTWRAKFLNNPEDGSSWGVVTEYADGTVEYVVQKAGGDGWKEITMLTDSMLDATRIYGYLETPARRGTTLSIDSIEMVRKRVDKERYNRRYTLKRLRRVLPEVDIKSDSIGTK